jgi:hypothetical protein
MDFDYQQLSASSCQRFAISHFAREHLLHEHICSFHSNSNHAKAPNAKTSEISLYTIHDACALIDETFAFATRPPSHPRLRSSGLRPSGSGRLAAQPAEKSAFK